MSASPGDRRRVVLATRSAGKLRELQPMFAAAGYEAVGLDALGVAESAAEAGIERYDTFEANALAKARYFAALLPGFPVVADDSGLVVDALGGAPGVRSKRFAGVSGLGARELDAANNARLQRELDGVSDRGAGYVCVVAWVDGGRELLRRGETRGRILTEARGAGGFGYDPYFWSDDLGQTFGESDQAAKARVSHRGRAVAALLTALRAGAPA
ncbi:MAG TPA: non-canonical purine NTP pyrophosphatase [Gemmatimonadaceae bacterium]|nr:non-canonical purine NTP pyrophosphatase [Gemmatimonadaceae bacterium]